MLLNIIFIRVCVRSNMFVSSHFYIRLLSLILTRKTRSRNHNFHHPFETFTL
ncbi:hypothetical protein NC99_31230 [Sunxiuqinia dokdonensis]|uniref:Uncharacterized protein n=1 Tax=Sunxiuqinia dokdonensis TaxID=1409788 RepID=A0A0L8V6Q1_9BACT|nr:hypothetical protein NC99_31230 [Sunxiuqinia dokdonensis]